MPCQAAGSQAGIQLQWADGGSAIILQTRRNLGYALRLAFSTRPRFRAFPNEDMAFWPLVSVFSRCLS